MHIAVVFARAHIGRQHALAIPARTAASVGKVLLDRPLVPKLAARKNSQTPRFVLTTRSCVRYARSKRCNLLLRRALFFRNICDIAFPFLLVQNSAVVLLVVYNELAIFRISSCDFCMFLYSYFFTSHVLARVLISYCY